MYNRLERTLKELMQPHWIEKKIGDLDVLEVPGDPGGVHIVLFHGFGSDASDLVPLSRICKKKPLPTWIFPRGPLEIVFHDGYTGRAWFPIDSEALHQALQEKKYNEIAHAFPVELSTARQMGEQFIDGLDIPRSQLFLGGFSQGAILATELTLYSTFRSAGLLILSGTLINAKNWKHLAPLHALTPFFQSHGEQDTLLPIEKSIELEKILVDGGLKGKLHRFHGGHEIPPSTLAQLGHFLQDHY